MNEQLKLLVELQEIDSAILSLSDQIESLPRKLERFRVPMKEAEAAFQAIKSRSEDFNKRKSKKDLELEEVQDKINKLKTRGSDIKTNKEYEAHKKEIESFEKKIYKIEDDILSLMEEAESFEGNIQSEEVKVKAAQEACKEQEKLVAAEQEKLSTEIEGRKAKREDFISRIDEGIYAQYKNLLKKTGGRAVAEAAHEICLGCNTNIPPQLYNDIRKNEGMYKCFFCQRFLYHKDPPATDNNSPETASAS